jgi:hypothetical protein
MVGAHIGSRDVRLSVRWSNSASKSNAPWSRSSHHGGARAGAGCGSAVGRSRCASTLDTTAGSDSAAVYLVADATIAVRRPSKGSTRRTDSQLALSHHRQATDQGAGAPHHTPPVLEVLSTMVAPPQTNRQLSLAAKA